jgi:hypothetical protein
VIVFISPIAVEGNPSLDWAATASEQIIRQCPECKNDSVIGHGRRAKQAHDEQHDWIKVRRGLCKRCPKTITFLPCFSLPYTHYSLLARSQSLKLHFVDGRSLDTAIPLLKDPDRVPAATTIRSWCRSLDSAERWECLQKLEQAEACISLATSSGSTIQTEREVAFPFLHKMMSAVSDRLAQPEKCCYGKLVVTWPTLAHFLKNLLPLRC